MAPELQIGRDVRADGGVLSAGALDEPLVPEHVVEVPVTVDDPPNRLPEHAQVVEQLVGLPEVGACIDDEQRVAAPHDTDVQIEAR